jgi:hypothetical protein
LAPGLGQHLYEALDRKAAIIGVAKNRYRDSQHAIEVCRGKSAKPLFVTSIGMTYDVAALHVKSMVGEFRIPSLLKQVDRLCREGVKQQQIRTTGNYDSRKELRMDDERFDRLLTRMEQSAVASRQELVGCSASEIAALESQYELKLPHSYRRYLEVMGHNSGRLFKHDHLAVTYSYVLKMTANELHRWTERNAADGSGPPKEFEFPKDALLIAGRLGEQFEYIRCHGQDDAPVWYLNNYSWQTKEWHPSVLDWLECWCEAAEDAIARGYFDKYPNGTTP